MFERDQFAGDYSRIFAALAALAAIVAVALLTLVGSASAATRDTTPPTIIGTSPAETDSTDVPVTNNVLVTFSENMKRKTVNGTTFQLFNSGVKVGADVSCSRPCRTAKLNPKRNLRPGAVYQASVRGGRKGPKDLAGNGLTSGMQWSFSTTSAASVDATKPTIALSTPADGATYALNQDVAAKYSCQDENGGSGLKSCEGTVPNGSPIDTASPGQKSFTVTATDNAGNTDSVTRTYTVSECTILGTPDKDVLEGTEGDDVICGLGGNDVLKGLGGNDLIKGGEGYDTASFENSSQAIDAALMENTASGEGSDELIDIERLFGSLYDDTLIGNDHYNGLTGNAGNDTLWGRGGGDGLYGWMGNDELNGGLGNDSVRGGTGADELFGDEGGDSLHSQDNVEGNDSLDGGAGTDTKVTDATEASIVNIP